MTDPLSYFISPTSTTVRIVVILVTAILAHLLVILVRRLSVRVMAAISQRRLRKVRAINSLISSTIMFMIYFGAFGIVLNEIGISLTAYLASASVIGLAIAFGSQGVVQDVVSGLTIVMADIFDVGDMVKVGDEVGVVKEIGMRYTVIENALSARVMIPNRSITSVVRYPRGYVRAIADITLPENPEHAVLATRKIDELVQTAMEQFAGVFRSQPENLGKVVLPSGRAIQRVKFRIWPGRGTPLETTFRAELISSLKELDPNYPEWWVAINHEVEAPAIRQSNKG